APAQATRSAAATRRSSGISAAVARKCRTFALKGLIRGDDRGHEAMAYHVAVGEMNELDTLGVRQHSAGLLESGELAAGQIDLRYVTRDHGLGVVAEPGQEHLHLFRGGVLRLIENDEGIVEGTPAHERER